MRYRAISFLLILLLLFVSNVNAYVSEIQKDSYDNDLVFIDDRAEDDDIFDDLKSSNFILYNLNDNELLYEKDSNERISIASLTKIMTTMVVLENVEDLDETIVVSADAFYDLFEYAQAGFKVGDVVTYRDLLYGIMLPSGAEAAQEAAIAVSGSLDEFVVQMNNEAQKIGLVNTHFSNPVGRDDEDNYSTLNDLAKLLFYALDNEDFYQIYTTRNYITTNNLKLSSTLVSPSVKFKLDVGNILGSKSGYTGDAGLCLSSIASYNGISYLLITAGAPYEGGYPNHIVDTLNIYNYYFDNYSYRDVLIKGQELVTLDIKDSFEKIYTVTSLDDVSIYLSNDIDLEELEYRYDGVEYLDYKIKTNDKLGSVEIVYDNDVLYIYDVYLNDTIKYKHTKLILSILGVILLLIIIITFVNKKRKRRRRRRKNGKRVKK